MPEILILCIEFFKTGLFAVGGGLATLPFLTQMAVDHPHWFTQEMLADMIAVSESTPGPLGVNMATYVGYTVEGIPGAILATASLVLPSIIVILIVAKFLQRFNENQIVGDVFMGLRPAVTGLIGAAGFSVIAMALFDSTAFAAGAGVFASIHWVSVAVFAVILGAQFVKKLSRIHPVVYIAIGAVAGIVLKL